MVRCVQFGCGAQKMKGTALVLVGIIVVAVMPPTIACGYCPPTYGHPPKSRPPKSHPPKGGGHYPPKGRGHYPPGTGKPPSGGSPVIGPPRVSPSPRPPGTGKPPSGGIPVIGPPTVTPSPGSGYPPYPGTPPSGGSPVVGPPGAPGILPPIIGGNPPGILPPIIGGNPPSSGGGGGGGGGGGVGGGGGGGGGAGGGGGGGGGGTSCPLNALKLGACVDLLGGLVHVVIGDQAVNQCCPVIQGVAGLEAALCLCTTIRAKVLNLNILLPLALELIASCGMTPPPGFNCPNN